MSAQTTSNQSLHGILCAVLESVMHANHQSALKTLQAIQTMGFTSGDHQDMGKAQYLQFEADIMEAHGSVNRTVKIPLLSIFSPKLIGIQQAEVAFSCHVDTADLATSTDELDIQAIEHEFSEFFSLKISSEKKADKSIAIEMKINIAEIPMQAGYKQLMDNLSESHTRTHKPHTKKSHDAK